jgi:hypothetical protein
MTNWFRAFAPWLIVLTAGAFMLGVLEFTRRPSVFDRDERSTAEMPIQEEVLEANIPPIDAAAPSKTETATFALG